MPGSYQDSPDDPIVERQDGPTPNGGVRSEMIYLDGERNAVPRSKAEGGEVVEYDADDQVIMRTYFKVDRFTIPTRGQADG